VHKSSLHLYPADLLVLMASSVNVREADWMSLRLTVDGTVPVPWSPITNGSCSSNWIYMLCLPALEFSQSISFLFRVATKIFFFSVMVSSVVAHYQFCSLRPVLYLHLYSGSDCTCVAMSDCPAFETSEQAGDQMDEWTEISQASPSPSWPSCKQSE